MKSRITCSTSPHRKVYLVSPLPPHSTRPNTCLPEGVYSKHYRVIQTTAIGFSSLYSRVCFLFNTKIKVLMLFCFSGTWRLEEVLISFPQATVISTGAAPLQSLIAHFRPEPDSYLLLLRVDRPSANYVILT